MVQPTKLAVKLRPTPSVHIEYKESNEERKVAIARVGKHLGTKKSEVLADELIKRMPSLELSRSNVEHVIEHAQAMLVSPERDLNKATDDELTAAKRAMDASFDKAAVKPGDPTFEYDKRASFDEAVESSSWDEENEAE